jgi:hypothetical protein
MQRLSIDDAGRHSDVELASEPLKLHVLDACLVVARERDQGGVALHSTTLGYGFVAAVLAELPRRRHHPVPHHGTHVVTLVLARVTGVAFWRKGDTFDGGGPVTRAPAPSPLSRRSKPHGEE